MWDYQWMFCCWENNGIALIPSRNLITNIGLGNDATGTQRASRVAGLESYPIGTLTHPDELSIDVQADRYTFFDSGFFFHPTLVDKARWSIKALVPEDIRALLKKFRHDIRPKPIFN